MNLERVSEHLDVSDKQWGDILDLEKQLASNIEEARKEFLKELQEETFVPNRRTLWIEKSRKIRTKNLICQFDMIVRLLEKEQLEKLHDLNEAVQTTGQL